MPRQAGDGGVAEEVDSLKTELADTQKKLTAALADLAQVQAQNQQPQAPCKHD